MLRAMRRAAEKRLAGVTSKTRRRYYGHAAHLVAICEAFDPAASSERACAIRVQLFPHWCSASRSRRSASTHSFTGKGPLD